MAKKSRNFYLDEEVLALIERLSESQTKKLGTRISQAAVIEMAVRRMAKEEEK